MTPQGHLLRTLEKIWIGALVIAVCAMPVRGESDQPADGLFTEAGSSAKPVGPTQEGPESLAPGEKVEMTAEGNFDLSVQGADLRMVLRQLSRQARKNIIVSKSVEGKANLDLYGVTMQEALEAILKSNDLVSVEEGNFIYVYTAEEFAELRKMEYRVFKLFYIRADDAKKLITDVLSANGKVATTPPPEEGILEAPMELKDWGGAQDHASEAILVVHDYRENLDKVANIIQEIDVKPEQVLIEATILSANLDETNALGVDLQVLAGVDFQTFGVTSDLTGMTGGSVKDFNHAQGRVVTPFTNNFPQGSNPMSIGFINNNVGVFIKALEGITDTTVLANPKLLVVNKQRGDVLVGNMDGYLTTTVSQTVATETVEFLETGTKLRVRPFIGKDGYIRMELHPEISRGQVEQLTETGPALPSKQTTEVTLNVLVRDGKTLVIAGLFRDQVIIQRNQTPVLGNIPLVGQLFRSTVDTTVREEVIILLTPHIIQQEADELVSERIRDDIERTRVGVRKGLQWFSRSKLADSYVRWARNYARNGEISKAMWNLDVALSLEPKMIDAIRLKERLTHKAYWADQPAFLSTRNVIKRMLMEEMGKPYEEVSYPTKPLDANKLSPEVRERLGIENGAQLPLSWPDGEPAKVETPGRVESVPALSEPVVTADEPAEEIKAEEPSLETPAETSPETPTETPMDETVEAVEQLQEPATEKQIPAEQLEKPARKDLEFQAQEKPLKKTPEAEPVVESVETTPEILPVEEPVENVPAVEQAKPVSTTQPSVEVESLEPDFGPQPGDEPKAADETQAGKPAVREAKKSLAEELLKNSGPEKLNKEASSTAETQKKVSLPVSKPTKTESPTPAKSDSTPTTMSAGRAKGWAEPLPLSQSIQSVAKK